MSGPQIIPSPLNGDLELLGDFTFENDFEETQDVYSKIQKIRHKLINACDSAPRRTVIRELLDCGCDAQHKFECDVLLNTPIIAEVEVLFRGHDHYAEVMHAMFWFLKLVWGERANLPRFHPPSHEGVATTNHKFSESFMRGLMIGLKSDGDLPVRGEFLHQ